MIMTEQHEPNNEEHYLLTRYGITVIIFALEFDLQEVKANSKGYHIV